MSQKDRQEWAAMLLANPALNAAWRDYRDMLNRMTAKDPLAYTVSDLKEMRDKMERLLALQPPD